MKAGEGVRERFLGAGRVRFREVKGSWIYGVMGRVKVGNIMVRRVVRFPQEYRCCLAGKVSRSVKE